MKIKTGLVLLIIFGVLGIANAIFLILTCPFAAQVGVDALVREGTEITPGLEVETVVVPGVRERPFKKIPVVGAEVSFLGTATLVFLIALAVLTLKRKTWHLFGFPITPRAMGLLMMLIVLWNTVFAAFLVGIEVVMLREL